MDETLLRSFERSLRARNRSERTVRSYVDTARLLASHTGQPLDETTRADVERFLGAMLETRSPASVALYFRSLRPLFNWMLAEDIIEASPMAGLRAPSVPEQPVPVLSDDDLGRLLKACDGKGFEQRRDVAIVRLLIDTGIRVGELVGLAVDDVDFRGDTVTVLGKGSKRRVVPFGHRTGEALDRYARERRKHPAAREPAFWIGSRGPMTVSGVAQMLRKRARQAGLGHVHPHQFRHGFAHSWLAAGGTEDGLVRLAGWADRTMVSRYGASMAAERARDEHRRLAPGDRV